MRRSAEEPAAQGVVSDRIDATIVRALLDDGRATLATLSELSGLSVSAVQARVQRLERRGVIQGYRADVDFEALGYPVRAFVSVRPLDYMAQDEVPDRLRAIDGVVACYSVTGAPSYILAVRTASPGALEDLLNEIHRAAPVATETTMVLRAYFEDEPPPLPHA